MSIAATIENTDTLNGSSVTDGDVETTAEIDGNYTKPKTTKTSFAEKLKNALAESQDKFKALFYKEVMRLYRKSGLSREDFTENVNGFLSAVANDEYPVKSARVPRSPEKLLGELTNRFSTMTEDEIATISSSLGKEDKELLSKLLSN